MSVFGPFVERISKLLHGSDTSIQALAPEDGELTLSNIEPTAVFGRVVHLEPVDQTTSFAGRKRFIKACRRVDVEVVADKDDF